jgi:ABC-2 type transport system ATP-binding protein
MSTSSVRDQASTAGDSASAMRPAILRAEGLTKTFHRGIWPRRRAIPVLRGADLQIDAGELVGSSARTARERAR